MSTLAAYPAYQDVGHRWLDRIPATWSTSRMRYLCDIGTGSGDTVDAEPDGEYTFIVRSDTPLRAKTYEFDCEAILTAGDGGVGEVFHHIKGKFLAHQRVYVLRNFQSIIDPRFFYYYFSSHFRQMAQDGSARTTVDSVRRWMLTDMPFAVPPLPEQFAIADFLDRETGQIDRLIEKQEQLIATLRERRATVMDSLVLGEATASSQARQQNYVGEHRAVEPRLRHIPPHWAVARVKAVLVQLDERNVGALQPMMSLKSSGEIVPRSTLGERQEPDPSNIPRYLVARPGDLVVNPMWLTGGAVGVSETTGAVSPDYRVFRSRGDHHPRYLHHLLRTRPYRDQYVLYTRANTTFDRRVQQDDLDNLPLPIPPMREQASISASVDEETSKIDVLIGRAERFIGLARERRAALVSAAVTGRVDVRGAA